MKAIIKGRGYVTDNAELLGEVTINGARTGLKWWSAGLYRIPARDATSSPARATP